MRKGIIFCLLFVVLVHLFGIAYATDKPAVEFSADVIEVHPKDPSKNFKGTLHVGNNIMRKDFFYDNSQAVMILDIVKQTATMLMPYAKTYMMMTKNDMESLFGHVIGHLPKVLSNGPCAGRSDLICQEIGQEKIDDRDTEKWKVESQTGVVYQWVDHRLRVTIREEFSDHIYELRNIKEGHQPDNLFQIPAGYKRMQ